MMRTALLAALVLATVVAGQENTCSAPSTAGAVCSQVEAGIALGQAHSHNTYEQPGGLRDALAAGFCSFEADFFYNGSALWIAHDQENIRDDWTMQSKFLNPLAKLAQANGGDVYPASRVFGACRSVVLLCDAKEYNDDSSEQAARRQFNALERVIKSYADKYPGLFTVFHKNGTIVPGQINVYVSGLRPMPEWVAAKQARPLALDGRLVNLLDNKFGPAVYPLVSQGFHDVCPAPSPPDGSSLEVYSQFQAACMVTYAQLIGGYVRAAHQQHRIIRFWATADTPAVWDAVINAGVDLVNVDALQAFRAFAFEKWGTRTALSAYEKNGRMLKT